MKNKIILVLGLAAIVIFVGWFFTGGKETTIANAKTPVTVYKSPTCGCCVKYVGILEANGYDVEVMEIEDMTSIKNKYGIPYDMESCHTSIFGDYAVEGHVPLEVVENMLKEKPDIAGIALPDMPAGSPGMPGLKDGPFTIYTLGGEEVYTTY